MARARRDQNTRTAIETKRARAAKEVADAASVLVTVEEKLNAWRGRWQSVLIDLNRKANEEPAETEAVLLIFQETEKEHQTAMALAERIAGMTAELERFQAAVNAISEGNGDPFASVLLLERQLTNERARGERRRVLAEARAKARADWLIASGDLAAADTKLRAVLDLIGAAGMEDAASRLTLSDERTRYETMRDDAETKLRTAGDGLTTGLLREEAAGHSPVEDVARIEAAAFQRKEAIDAAQRAAEAASTMRQEMERRVADTSANAAAADQQAAIASMSSALDEALVYHAASLMLGKALDAMGRSGDSAMLARLSDIFQMLTCGEYSQAATEIDDNGKASFALVQRDFPDERQSIRQLSEGTRDQFFLALRAAAIEDHLKSAEPLPFIGDDILQTFDDQRSLAALRMLTDLSHHTQIIILTHHRHLLDLAAGLPKGSTFLCEPQSDVRLI